MIQLLINHNKAAIRDTVQGLFNHVLSDSDTINYISLRRYEVITAAEQSYIVNI